MKYLINYIDLGIAIGFVGKRAFHSFILTVNTLLVPRGKHGRGLRPLQPPIGTSAAPGSERVK